MGETGINKSLIRPCVFATQSSAYLHCAAMFSCLSCGCGSTRIYFYTAFGYRVDGAIDNSITHKPHLKSFLRLLSTRINDDCAQIFAPRRSVCAQRCVRLLLRHIQQQRLTVLYIVTLTIELHRNVPQLDLLNRSAVCIVLRQ